MPRKVVLKERGVLEKQPAYDILRGVMMPSNRKDKGVMFLLLAQEAIHWMQLL